LTDKEGWIQSLYFVTPPREQHTHPIDGSPIIQEDTDVFRFSFDLVRPKREGGEATLRRKRGEINDRAVQEPYNDNDATKTWREELITQFTALY
jgi:hypothetical protein